MTNHSSILTSDGKVYTWGCNGAGRLGHDDLKMRPNPTRLLHFTTREEGRNGVREDRMTVDKTAYSLSEEGGEQKNSKQGNNAFEKNPHLADLEHIIMLAAVGYRPASLKEVVLLLREEPMEWLNSVQRSRTHQMLETQKTMRNQCLKWKRMKKKLSEIENNIELCVTSTVRKVNKLSTKRIVSGHVDRSIKRFHHEFSMLLSTLVMEPGYLLEMYREMVTYNMWDDM